MKYIDAEQLKAELDKRYAEYRTKMKTDDFTYYEGMADALDFFEQYIDSLPEQPVEGLEEAADAHIRRVADAAGHPGWDWETQDIAEAFKAGAEWMAQQGEVLTTETVDELCYDCHNRLPELIEKTSLSADDRVELIVRKI